MDFYAALNWRRRLAKKALGGRVRQRHLFVMCDGVSMIQDINLIIYPEQHVWLIHREICLMLQSYGFRVMVENFVIIYRNECPVWHII